MSCGTATAATVKAASKSRRKRLRSMVRRERTPRHNFPIDPLILPFGTAPPESGFGILCPRNTAPNDKRSIRQWPFQQRLHHFQGPLDGCGKEGPPLVGAGTLWVADATVIGLLAHVLREKQAAQGRIVAGRIIADGLALDQLWPQRQHHRSLEFTRMPHRFSRPFGQGGQLALSQLPVGGGRENAAPKARLQTPQGHM